MTIREFLIVLALLGMMSACVVDEADAEDPTETRSATASQASPTPADVASQPPPATEASATATLAATPTTPPASATETPVEATPTPVTGPLPLDQINIDLELVIDGLEQPSGFAVPGDGSNRFFILEQEGRIRIVEDGQLLVIPFLDIVDQVGSTGLEQGLLGLAFDPEYVDNGYFYVNYTDVDGHTMIARFTVTDDPNRADPTSETELLSVEQPHDYHNGGNLVFGPDGYLWIGLGDGGAASDVFENAQNPETLLGAMLRVDVSGGDEPYAIPADNPFIDDPDLRDEIWSYGLRNPWRYAFDAETSDLYIADVGQGAWEEINLMPAGSEGGENYGWSMVEGTHCFNVDPCDDIDGLTPPIIEYGHDKGCAITGGYVYRGADFPALWGTYLYADYCSGRFWGARVTEDGLETRQFFQRLGAFFSSFGQDDRGEVYILSMESGALYRVIVF